VQNCRPPQISRLERVADCGIIAPRRTSGAHLHRPWRASLRRGTLRRPPDSSSRAVTLRIVSRPGESAAVALLELKYRYPPTGETWADTYFFYGGTELWEARLDGATAIVGVTWPLESRPSEGTSTLYLVKPRESAPVRRQTRTEQRDDART